MPSPTQSALQLEATPSIHEDVVSGTTGLGLDIHLHELLGLFFMENILTGKETG